MRIEFPDLKNQEKNTLYIIGNGFDLFHGIESKYEDFYYWLNTNRYKDFANDLLRVFPNLNCSPNYLWSKLEDAMGEYDLDQLYKDFYVPTGNRFWNPEGWKATAIQIGLICIKLPGLLKEWAKQIDISHTVQELGISKDSWYLTFNYTKLLEDTYTIPSSHICHIHGCATDNEDVIVGHNIKEIVDHIYANNDEEEFSKREIAKVMNRFVKNIDDRIGDNHIFFDSLKQVSHVVVLGHSLSHIDLPYFYRVLNRIQHESNWHFAKHIGGNEIQINKFLEQVNKQKTIIRNKWIFNF